MAKTTEPGYVNRNGQMNLGRTDPPRAGTDFNQYVYVLRCLECPRNYGVNGAAIFERKCPFHQGGAPGLQLTDEELKLDRPSRS
jgi:hypothetical protein